MEPPGIPVDPGDMEVESQLRGFLLHDLLDLLPQLAQGLSHVGQILLLVLQKPAAFVIEADSPQEIHCLL